MKGGRAAGKGEWSQLVGGRKRATAAAEHKKDKAGAACGA